MTRRTLISFAAGLTLALTFGWLGLPPLLYARAEQPLRFSHRTHTSDKTGYKCEDCHALREDGRFAGIPGAIRSPSRSPSIRRWDGAPIPAAPVQ